MARLITTPALRDELGLAASRKVRAEFATAPGLDRLAVKFKALV